MGSAPVGPWPSHLTSLGHSLIIKMSSLDQIPMFKAPLRKTFWPTNWNSPSRKETFLGGYWDPICVGRNDPFSFLPTSQGKPTALIVNFHKSQLQGIPLVAEIFRDDTFISSPLGAVKEKGMRINEHTNSSFLFFLFGTYHDALLVYRNREPAVHSLFPSRTSPASF